MIRALTGLLRPLPASGPLTAGAAQGACGPWSAPLCRQVAEEVDSISRAEQFRALARQDTS